MDRTDLFSKIIAKSQVELLDDGKDGIRAYLITEEDLKEVLGISSEE